jgi:hypothetical protein
MDKKLPWLSSLITFGGAITSIILTAIGGVMMANVILKLYVFKFDTPEYSSATKESCRMDYAQKIVPATPTELTQEFKERSAEEIDQCIAEKRAEEKSNYTRQKQESLVDGLAMLLVGIPFWVIFERRRKHEK